MLRQKRERVLKYNYSEVENVTVVNSVENQVTTNNNLNITNLNDFGLETGRSKNAKVKCHHCGSKNKISLNIICPIEPSHVFCSECINTFYVSSYFLLNLN